MGGQQGGQRDWVWDSNLFRFQMSNKIGEYFPEVHCKINVGVQNESTGHQLGGMCRFCADLSVKHALKSLTEQKLIKANSVATA